MDRSQEKEAQDKRRRLFGAILLASDGPVSAQSIAELVNAAVDEEEWDEAITVDEVVKTLSFMQSNFDGQHGIELVEVADGWRLRTAGDVAHVLRRLWPERRLRLSKAAMETLSIIAYRQPCTRPDVESVRGVDCGGVVRSLLDRGLGCRGESGRCRGRARLQTLQVRSWNGVFLWGSVSPWGSASGRGSCDCTPPRWFYR